MPTSKFKETSNNTASDTLVTIDAISELLTTSDFELDQLLKEIVRTSAEKMNLKASAIRLINEVSRELELKAVHGLSERFLTEGPEYGLESRFRRLIANGGVLRIDDIREESDLRTNEGIVAEGIQSLLAVGLYADEELIGAISVYSSAPHAFSDDEIAAFRVVANQVSVAIHLTRLIEASRAKERMDHDLKVAAEIQRRALPADPPEVAGFRLACRYVPWLEVGGDFYDFIELPLGNLGMAVGDVSGKGIRAALLSLAVRSALHVHAEYEYSISEIVGRLNRTICRDTDAEQFATLFYGVLSVTTGILTFVTALCPAPIVVRNGEITELDTDDLPVGILADTEFHQDFIRLESGDLLVIYSDGYSEIFNKQGDMFGDDRVREWVLANRELSPAEMIDRLEEQVNQFLLGSKQGDDRTIVVVKVD